MAIVLAFEPCMHDDTIVWMCVGEWVQVCWAIQLHATCNVVLRFQHERAKTPNDAKEKCWIEKDKAWKKERKHGISNKSYVAWFIISSGIILVHSHFNHILSWFLSTRFTCLNALLWNRTHFQISTAPDSVQPRPYQLKWFLSSFFLLSASLDLIHYIIWIFVSQFYFENSLQ